jgi:hypothetical protein
MVVRLTKQDRTDLARQEHSCPRCYSPPGKVCRYNIPRYTPMGYGWNGYGQPMKQVHPERLELVPADGPNDRREAVVQGHEGVAKVGLERGALRLSLRVNDNSVFNPDEADAIAAQLTELAQVARERGRKRERGW